MTITAVQRQVMLSNSLVAGIYEKALDRESAYELLKKQAQGNGSVGTGTSAGSGNGQGNDGGLMAGVNDLLFGSTGPRGGQRDGLVQSMAKSAVRSIGTTVGKELLRGVLGSLLGGGGRRR